jgi:hypothetical protein
MRNKQGTMYCVACKSNVLAEVPASLPSTSSSNSMSPQVPQKQTSIPSPEQSFVNENNKPRDTG